MRFTFTGKDFNVNEEIKKKTTQKISRLSRLLPDDCEIHVTFSSVKIMNKVEVTVPLRKRTLRAESMDSDVLNAIDKVVDSLEKQMAKYKGQLNNRARRDTSFKEEYNFHFSPAEDTKETAENENNGVIIKKAKKFALKPMDAEEAVMNMELLGHSFFVFRNSQSDEVNVVYKRNDNAYGIIEPEY